MNLCQLSERPGKSAVRTLMAPADFSYFVVRCFVQEPSNVHENPGTNLRVEKPSGYKQKENTFNLNLTFYHCFMNG